MLGRGKEERQQSGRPGASQLAADRRGPQRQRQRFRARATNDQAGRPAPKHEVKVAGSCTAGTGTGTKEPQTKRAAERSPDLAEIGQCQPSCESVLAKAHTPGARDRAQHNPPSSPNNPPSRQTTRCAKKKMREGQQEGTTRTKDAVWPAVTRRYLGGCG